MGRSCPPERTENLKELSRAWAKHIWSEGAEIVRRAGGRSGLRIAIERMFAAQRKQWPLLERAVRDLAEARYKTLTVDGRTVRVQCNPRRLKSITAPVSPEQVASRPCFLCPENNPPDQKAIPLAGGWMAMFNPFPLFERHVVVLTADHVPQTVYGTMEAMLEFTVRTGYTCLYNGPRSGASAPDHLHFQATPTGFLPLEGQVPQFPRGRSSVLADPRLPQRIYLEADFPGVMAKLFGRVMETMNALAGRDVDAEPDLNLAVIAAEGVKCPRVVIHPRGKHRPDAYYREGQDRLLVSPGAADMASLVITPREEDFARLNGRLMKSIFREVCLPGKDFAALAQALETWGQPRETG